MKYRLNIEDYVKINLRLSKDDPSFKKRYIAFRALVTFLVEFLCFALTGATGNFWFFLISLILLVPIWIFTKAVYIFVVKAKFKNVVKNNLAYTSDVNFEIKENTFVTKTPDFESIVELNKIQNVFYDNDFVYFDAGSIKNIIPLRAFSSETEKAQFIDSLKLSVKN